MAADYTKLKAVAKDLFMLGYTQTQIAEITKVSIKTMSQWAIAGKWQELRAEEGLKAETITDLAQNLLITQLKALSETGVDPETGKPKKMDKGDIDAAQKLHTMVKGKTQRWADIVNNVRELVDFIASQDSELAKLIMPLVNEYIMAKRKEVA